MRIEVDMYAQPEKPKRNNLALDKNAYPQRGFFYDFMEYASPLTDAPDEFLFGPALVCVAGVIGNKICIPFGSMQIYPNLWILLLAKSSIFRKSTSITIARQIVEKIEGTVIMPDQSTPETFLEDLQENPCGIYVLYELGSFLKNMERSYMRGFKEDLTHIYDCPPKFRRRRKNPKGERITIEITHPCISLISGSTIEWFLEAVREDDICGGFLPRFLYIPAEIKEKETIILPPPKNLQKENKLVRKLQRIREKTGQILIHPETETFELYRGWVEKIEKKSQDHRQESLLAAFYTRLEIAALKIAMIIEASLNEISDNHTLSPESMDYAIKIADWFRKNIAYLLEERLAFTPAEKKKMKILDMLKQKDIISHSELLQRSHLSAREFSEVVTTLKQCGKIKEVSLKGRRGPAGKGYKFIRNKNY